jgi:phthalate 4,5-cis-dihydrodiol dehydrogenase
MKDGPLVDPSRTMTAESARRLRIGVVGLGRAFSIMIPTFLQDSRVELVAGADPRDDARRRFASDFKARTFLSVESLCADPDVEVVYISTPHQHHATHAKIATSRGKHVLVEKPMALTIADARSMIEEASRAGIHLIVGHSHSFDAPIKRARQLIDSGAFGSVRMITALNYTDYLYRPRRPEELDTGQGGGALFNQAPHQVDIVRLLGGGLVRSLRATAGAWDPRRPTEGAYGALLTFANGAFATLTYNGYGHFDSDEFQGWIGEMGQAKQPKTAAAFRRFADPAEEAAFKVAHTYGGDGWRANLLKDSQHQHFGPIVVSCDNADLRPLPNGVMIHQNGVARLDSLPAPRIPRVEVIDELYGAVVHNRPPLHSGAWAMATLEVCLAILRSARESREVTLRHQVGIS